jgi:hypothetical protein
MTREPPSSDAVNASGGVPSLTESRHRFIAGRGLDAQYLDSIDAPNLRQFSGPVPRTVEHVADALAPAVDMERARFVRRAPAPLCGTQEQPGIPRRIGQHCKCAGERVPYLGREWLQSIGLAHGGIPHAILRQVQPLGIADRYGPRRKEGPS